MATTHCIRCKAEIDRAFKACPHCGEPVTEFLRRYADEPVDGKYKIVERLGAGGMGEVYKVTHTFLGATRVIKVIRTQISESEDAHERFLREARAATKVQHPNVATLHDFSALPDGSHYMVWEFIDGENLAQRIRSRGTFPPRYAVQIAIQALHGLDAIHRAGIVHRDISPENLMITHEAVGEERVKIIDMGVAKIEDSTDNATRAGVFVGKLRYASPEHLGFLPEGERIDARADLYSMGMVLYEMLTGRPPFEATSPHEYVLLHSRDTQFKPLDLPADLPGGEQLQAVLAKSLERDRNKRYSSAREFARALEEVERTLPDPSSMRTLNLATPDTAPTFITPLPQARDTLHRSTVRTGVEEAGPTVRTPLPGPFTPPPQRRAGPTQPDQVVAKQESSSTSAFLIIAVIVIVAVAAIAFVLMRKSSTSTTAASDSAAIVNPQTTRKPAEPAANVDVVSPAPLPTTTQPIQPPPNPVASATMPPPTTTTQQPVQVAQTTQQPAATAPAARPPVTATAAAAARKQPAVVPVEQPPAEEPKPVPAQSAVRTYVDGEGGDSDVNDQLLTEFRKQFRGTRQVTIRANGDMQKELAERLKKNASEVTVVEGADVVVEFNGVLDRLGRGKKRRSAQASVIKNGRVIFRYEMPPEEYRVGDTPAEAFARVLADALH